MFRDLFFMLTNFGLVFRVILPFFVSFVYLVRKCETAHAALNAEDVVVDGKHFEE
jgi:hypothetical protein